MMMMMNLIILHTYEVVL